MGFKQSNKQESNKKYLTQPTVCYTIYLVIKGRLLAYLRSWVFLWIRVSWAKLAHLTVKGDCYPLVIHRLCWLGHISPFLTFPRIHYFFFTPVFFLILQGIITCILQDVCCAWHGNILSRRAVYLDAAEKSTESEGYLAGFKCLFQVFQLHQTPKCKIINETNKMSPQLSVPQNAPERSVACPALAMAFSPTTPARVLPV